MLMFRFCTVSQVTNFLLGVRQASLLAFLYFTSESNHVSNLYHVRSLTVSAVLLCYQTLALYIKTALSNITNGQHTEVDSYVHTRIMVSS